MVCRHCKVTTHCHQSLVLAVEMFSAWLTILHRPRIPFEKPSYAYPTFLQSEPSSHPCPLPPQLFWEAFPAEGGTARTTYMFAYSDATPERPSFESLLDTYFELLPSYQKMEKTTLASDLHYKRVLFGGFPCYNSGPLVPAFDRVMQIGDASCIQSPLSFGGFGSMVRHLGRLTRALDQALVENRLSQYDLGLVQPYQPSLSASWLFQRAMSFNVGQARWVGFRLHRVGHLSQTHTSACT